MACAHFISLEIYSGIARFPCNSMAFLLNLELCSVVFESYAI